MGLLIGPTFRQRGSSLWGINSVADLIPRRNTGLLTSRYISDDQALRNSSVWAALRLRADLVSTLPLHAYRDVTFAGDSIVSQIEVDLPQVLISPGGERIGLEEWLYMSQIELDRSGNAIGLIVDTDRAGRPMRIDLYPSAACTVLIKDGVISYRINGKEYAAEKIWHERQYSVAGLPVGLSPVAYAAYDLAEYESIQDFVTSWFTSGAVPRARLQNRERILDQEDIAIVKEAWRASIAMGEPFVYGSDWEYNLMQTEQTSAEWLNAKKYSAVDIARFFGVPVDLIDGAVSGESVTYANIQQRNLQFLIMHLGPAIIRREKAFSNWLMTRPRYVKFDTDALLRMDPSARADMLRLKIESRQLAPSEARAMEDLPPFTEQQKQEFLDFWPLKPPKPPPERL